MAKTPNTYQHVVPKCYLKHFANKDRSDFVYVYDKIRNKTYTQAIDSIGGMDDFYSIKSADDGSYDKHVIEKELLAKNLEKEYSDVLGKTIDAISNGVQISDELRNSLAVHLAIQFLRLKEVREKDEELLNEIMPKMIRLFKHGLAIEKNNPQIADLEIDYKYDSTLYHYQSSFGNEDVVNTFAEQLALNYWNFYFSSSPVFYTSTFPIVVKAHVPNVRPLCMGLTQYGAELSFPISSNIMLVIWDREYFQKKSETDGKIIMATDEDIRKYNWMRYFYASQVFSKTNDFSILDFIFMIKGKHEFLKY